MPANIDITATPALVYTAAQWLGRNYTSNESEYISNTHPPVQLHFNGRLICILIYSNWNSMWATP